MLKIRYTEWDGSQRIKLTADQVFEKLSEYLSYTDDVQQALDWMMRQGFDWEGMQVLGLDDFLEQLREAMRQRYRDFNLNSALDEMRQRLDEIVDLERDTLEHGEVPPERAQVKRDFLDQLPHRLSEAIERMKSYDFEDSQAAGDFENLLEELEDISELEDFQRRHGDMFHGPKSLGYQDALDLMREMNQLKQLEEALSDGDFERVSLDELRDLLGPQAFQDFQTLKQVRMLLRDAGYLAGKEGRAQLSPKGVRRIGQLALRDIFQGLMRDRPGSHQVDHRGQADARPDATKLYHYGDPLNLDLVRTLKKALARKRGAPLALEPTDFEVFDTQYATTTSTVLLLDMSWSMSWEGRFAAAKKVALAMESLVRSRYPRDYFAIVGFFTRAIELKVKDLPEASWNMGDPFTNLQDGLRLASDLLRRHPSNNQQVIVITDGQPTAYFSRGRLYCEWPLSFGGISMRAAQETLKEVERVTKRGITINTFMLDDSPSLRAFVERMTRINKGRALYTRPDHLGEYLLVDYIGKKRKKV
ncbi:MAG: VWA domain-containing protein [Deltaproteobacteria bacterium]|nr:VWA domain-containing protein [Deltaproteobacteria bacterium]MBI3390652.1 VWA domain-containing protein [Deltaproteobacteria bacterium]